MSKLFRLTIVVCLPVLLETLLRAATSSYSFTSAFPGLIFTNPVCIVSPPGETNRLFIVERKGRIAVITNLAAPTRSVFMDISSQVINAADTSASGEEGLLGLAFHPGYLTNGFFYVFYTGGSGRQDILARYEFSGSNTNQGNSGSEIRYIVQSDEASNHNAGDLHFGPDGYLYVSLGDEGGSYGDYNDTQRIDLDFFSAIMRLDVDQRPGSLSPNPHASALPSLTNYFIPPDNPYVGVTSFNGLPVNPSNVRTEFWAVGMRNPWRFSFDPVTGTLYLGHVGQSLVEWVNIVKSGDNCGWNYYEGTKKWSNSIPAGFSLSPPLVEYGRTNGRNCIIGGIVYRGSRIAQLYGAYVYADHGSGEMLALRHSGINVTQNSILFTNASAKVNAFGVDPSNGDILCAVPRSGTNSTIERIVYNGPPAPSPVITEISLSGSDLLIRGNNGGPYQTFYLVGSTNLASPEINWSLISTGIFDATGRFAVTNAIDPILPQRFYRLQWP